MGKAFLGGWLPKINKYKLWSTVPDGKVLSFKGVYYMKMYVSNQGPQIQSFDVFLRKLMGAQILTYEWWWDSFFSFGTPNFTKYFKQNIHGIRANSNISWKPESSLGHFGHALYAWFRGLWGGQVLKDSLAHFLPCSLPTRTQLLGSQVLNLRKTEEQIKNGWPASPETIGENLTPQTAVWPSTPPTSHYFL